MSKLVLSFLVVFCFLFNQEVSAKIQVIDDYKNVKLVEADKYNEEGYNHGVDYYVHNFNDYAVWVWMDIVKSENSFYAFKAEGVYLKPGEKAYIGSITQNDSKAEYEWYYEWNVYNKLDYENNTDTVNW